MSCEKKYIKDFLKAATDQDWAEVDVLIPGLKVDLETGEVNNVCAKHMAEAWLRELNSKNGDIRDLAASVLAELPLEDELLKGEVIKKMLKLVVGDNWIFSAGRAAVVLLKYRDDENLKSEIAEALAVFKERALENNWEGELKENIASLGALF